MYRKANSCGVAALRTSGFVSAIPSTGESRHSPGSAGRSASRRTALRIPQLLQEPAQPGLRGVPLALDVAEGDAVLVPPVLDGADDLSLVISHVEVEFLRQV